MASSTSAASSLDTLERAFYHPLARLRAKGTGYAVSLIKAGAELAGYRSGGVRPPLTEVTPEHREELARILAAGLAAVPAPARQEAAR